MRTGEKISRSIDRQLAAQPREVRFCRRCVVSNQRPRIVFDAEGVCSACRYAEQKAHAIDWAARRTELEALCAAHRREDGRYDVIVPTSGGKDSASVAHKLRDRYGMSPLTVTWAPFRYTDIGWRNFQRFLAAGFTNLLATPDPRLHRRLARIALEAVGDAWQPFAYGQMAYAFQIAVQFDVPLVFFGENGEAEYGGDPRNNHRPYMPLEDWADLYFKGVTVDDLVAWGQAHGLLQPGEYREADLSLYRPPPPEALAGRGVQMHWFGYYERWIPQENFYYAAEHTGFEANPDGRSEGTYSRYASLDDRLDGFHYYLAYLKFGIGRATSDAAHEVRDGHITRDEAVALVHRFDGEFPAKYFAEFLEYVDLEADEFHAIADRYRPEHLWRAEPEGWALRARVQDLPA